DSLPQHTPLQGEIQKGGGPLSIVDIIPRPDSFETGQNSEPDITVNPASPMQMIASAFSAIGQDAPYYASTNGGTTWSSFANLNWGESTLAWRRAGCAARRTALLNVEGTHDRGSLINPYSSTVANGIFGFTITQLAGPIFNQPGIETAPANHVYIAYNDL